MSYTGVLSAEERERIVGFVNDRLRPHEHSGKVALWADTLAAAFEAAGRPVVFLDAGQSPSFYIYSPETGVYAPVRPLELSNLLMECGTDSKLPPSAVAAIAKALKARVGADQSFFAAGEQTVAFMDRSLTLDWSDPYVISPSDHSAEHKARSFVPLIAGSNSGAVMLMRFLDDMFGDPVAIERLTEQIGLALFGEGTLFQRAFIIHAEGGNGKGTFARLANAIFPKGQVTSVPPRDIPPEWGRAQLAGSKLNLVGEMDRLGEEDITVLKAIVTGEPISARNSRERGFTLESKAFQLIATNQLPQLGKRTMALARRFVVIDAKLQVPLEKQDPLFGRKLIAESAPAFLNLCVENARRAATRLKEGNVELHLSPQIEAATAALFGPDHVDDFIEMHLEQTTDLERDIIRTEEVREAYKAYCGRTRNTIIRQDRLVARLAAAGYPSQKLDGGFMHIVGARWRHPGA